MVLGGASALACSDGGDALTLEEYFKKLDEIDDEQTRASDALDEQISALEGEADVEVALDLFNQQVDLIEEFVEDVDGLDAPDEVSDVHEEALTNLREAVADFRDIVRDAEGATTLGELFASLEDADFSAFEAAAENCRELQQIATDSDIEVDLDC